MESSKYAVISFKGRISPFPRIMMSFEKHKLVRFILWRRGWNSSSLWDAQHFEKLTKHLNNLSKRVWRKWPKLSNSFLSCQKGCETGFRGKWFIEYGWRTKKELRVTLAEYIMHNATDGRDAIDGPTRAQDSFHKFLQTTMQNSIESHYQFANFPAILLLKYEQNHFKRVISRLKVLKIKSSSHCFIAFALQHPRYHTRNKWQPN